MFNADWTVQFVLHAHWTVQFVQCRWDSSICSMKMGQFNLFNADGTIQFVLVLLWKDSVLFSMLRKSRIDGVSGDVGGDVSGDVGGEASGKLPV